MRRRTMLASVLACLLAAGPSLALAAEVPLDGKLDENLVALFADLHATQSPSNTHQRAGIKRCVEDVLACNPRPAHVLLYGDLSINHGESADYQLLKKLLKPLEEAGIHWYACLGNHDRRGPFLDAFPDRKEAQPPVPGRLVSVVKTPHADFILLDSCLEGPTNGGIDDAQRTWLENTLRHYTKPVVVGAHHPIIQTGVAPLLASNTLCAAYLYGHQHLWKQERQEGVETLCLPSTGHWGDIGYVLVKLDAEGATFTLHQRDYYTPRPAAKPEDAKPEWRQRVQKNDGSQWRVMFKKAGAAASK